MILFSLSGTFKALLLLFRERVEIMRFGRYGWELAKRVYSLIEGEAEKDKGSSREKAIRFDSEYLEAYEKALKSTLTSEQLQKVREKVWRSFNRGKKHVPVGRFSKTDIRRVGKARRR